MVTEGPRGITPEIKKTPTKPALRQESLHETASMPIDFLRKGTKGNVIDLLFAEVHADEAFNPITVKDFDVKEDGDFVKITIKYMPGKRVGRVSELFKKTGSIEITLANDHLGKLAVKGSNVTDRQLAQSLVKHIKALPDKITDSLTVQAKNGPIIKVSINDSKFKVIFAAVKKSALEERKKVMSQTNESWNPLATTPLDANEHPAIISTEAIDTPSEIVRKRKVELRRLPRVRYWREFYTDRLTSSTPQIVKDAEENLQQINAADDLIKYFSEKNERSYDSQDAAAIEEVEKINAKYEAMLTGLKTNHNIT